MLKQFNFSWGVTRKRELKKKRILSDTCSQWVLNSQSPFTHSHGGRKCHLSWCSLAVKWLLHHDHVISCIVSDTCFEVWWTLPPELYFILIIWEINKYLTNDSYQLHVPHNSLLSFLTYPKKKNLCFLFKSKLVHVTFKASPWFV